MDKEKSESLKASREVFEWLLVHTMSVLVEIPESGKAGYLHNTLFQHISVEYISNAIAHYRTFKLRPKWEDKLTEAIERNLRTLPISEEAVKIHSKVIIEDYIKSLQEISLQDES